MSRDFERAVSFFETLTTIPRGSENCAGICRYLCDFAQQRALRYRSDAAHNVVIFKAASTGLEGKAPVILQGHIDMVCAAEEGCDIDFLHEGLTLERDGDFLSAKGTSLGADDGIAVAMMLALLDSDLPLPALECIFTADEEIGMIGATALDMSDLQGKHLINVDSEDEGVLTVSCAGGSTAVVTLPIKTETVTAEIYNVAVSGLVGGHSGMEIVKGGLNANKLLGTLLEKLPPCRLVSIGGGEKENAIAARASMRLAFEYPTDVKSVVKAVEGEFAAKEPQLQIICEDAGKQSCTVMDEDSSRRIKAALIALPQGIIKMSAFDESAVQTSLNLGVLEQDAQAVRFTFCVRSSVCEEREALEKRLADIAAENGGAMSISGVYPGWEYKADSVLRETAVRVFEQCFGYTPKIEAIHAGLECGVLLSKKPDLDCISLGPQLYDVHTARERLSLSSAERTWRYLVKLILALS